MPVPDAPECPHPDAMRGAYGATQVARTTASVTGEQRTVIPAAAPVVSVIVPVYNGGAAFARCLAALLASRDAPLWELIVVDDGSTDDSVRQAREAGARILQSPHPRSGPGVARNAGVAAAHGEFVFFVDADVAVAPDTLSRVVATFRAQPGLAALFGSYYLQPAASNFVSQYKNLFHHYIHQTSRAEATTFWAGCGAIRRAVFLELGGFDTAYSRPSIEDIELGYRLTRAGYAVRLCHDIQVTHLKYWTPRSLLRTDIVDRGIPWTVLLWRERAFAADLNLQTANRVSVVSVYLLCATLLAAPARPALLGAAALLVVALLGFNAPLYAFFLRQRGPRFLLAAIAWHWLYYAYNGLCFGLGTLEYLRSGRAARPAEQAANVAPQFSDKAPGSRQ